MWDSQISAALVGELSWTARAAMTEKVRCVWTTRKWKERPHRQDLALKSAFTFTRFYVTVFLAFALTTTHSTSCSEEGKFDVDIFIRNLQLSWDRTLFEADADDDDGHSVNTQKWSAVTISRIRAADGSSIICVLAWACVLDVPITLLFALSSCNKKRYHFPMPIERQRRV